MLSPPLALPCILRWPGSYTTPYCAVKDFFQVSPRRPPVDRPTRLGDVLRAALGRLPEAERLPHHALWAHWDAVVRPTIAAHPHPERMKRAVLFVAGDSAERRRQLP